MFYVSYGCSFIKGTAAFRVPWGLQMLPAMFLFGAMIFLPESPRWLARQDRWEDAIQVLALVHAHGDSNSPFVKQEMAEIREVVEFERANSDVTYWELLKPGMINRTHIGVFTQIWSQLTGMNVMMCKLCSLSLHTLWLTRVIDYITYIFTMAGLGSNVLLPSSIQFIINVVMTVPALLFVDRWGRRSTMLVGAFLMALLLFINAGLLATYGTIPYPGQFPSAAESISITGPAAKAVIACTYLFVASYAPTWGPVSWIYPPELYPLRVRGKAVALSTSSNWIFNFALAYFVPPAFENIRWKVYVIFGIFCVAMFVHVFFLFPETSQKPLEEVEDIFDDSTPGSIRYIGTPAWKTRVDRHAKRSEEGNVDLEEKFAQGISHDEGSPNERVKGAPKMYR